MKNFLVLLAIFLILAGGAYAEPLYPSAKQTGLSAWTLTWDNATANTADQSPGTDTAMNIYRASTITISCSTLTADDISAASAGTSSDVDVMSSPDCTSYDVTGSFYVENGISAMGDNIQKTFGLTPGPMCIKLRMDNGDGANTRDLTCRIRATWD